MHVDGEYQGKDFIFTLTGTFKTPLPNEHIPNVYLLIRRIFERFISAVRMGGLHHTAVTNTTLTIQMIIPKGYLDNHPGVFENDRELARNGTQTTNFIFAVVDHFYPLDHGQRRPSFRHFLWFGTRIDAAREPDGTIPIPIPD